MNKLNGKDFEICLSQDFHNQYGDIESKLYIDIVMKILEDNFINKLVFKMENEKYAKVCCIGDEEEPKYDSKVLYRFESLIIDEFLFKVDDYGDMYIGTFLFPDED